MRSRYAEPRQVQPSRDETAHKKTIGGGRYPAADLRKVRSYHFLWNDFPNFIMQQATFWRRSVLDRIGYFDESFHYALDAEYWIRAGAAKLNLQHVPRKLGRFRMIRGTKSLSSPTAFWEDYLEIYRRYRGRRSLRTYFAYYYFNLALQLDFDLEAAFRQGQRAFERWKALPLLERNALAHQAKRGLRLAYFVMASHLERRQDHSRASNCFRTGLARNPWLILHPLAWTYLIRRAGGQFSSRVLDRLFQRMVDTYRRHRYDYRYYENRGR